MIEERQAIFDDEFAEKTEKLIESIGAILDIEGISASERSKSLREIAYLQTELAIVTDETADELETSELDHDTFEKYTLAKVGYIDSRNPYYVMEAFCTLFDKGVAPPRWILMAIMVWFLRHMHHPDPDKMAKQFGIKGRASGASKPYDNYVREKNRRPAFSDMYSLIRRYRISKIDAARAVILKYDISISAKSFVNAYDKFFAWLKGVEIPLIERDEESRTQHYQTFPVTARKYLRTRRI